MHERLEVLRREVTAGLHDVDSPGAAIERDARELNDVPEALARLDTPEYGLCIDCESPIAWLRLQAQPETRRCLQCQARFERAHPQSIAEL